MLPPKLPLDYLDNEIEPGDFVCWGTGSTSSIIQVGVVTKIYQGKDGGRWSNTLVTKVQIKTTSDVYNPDIYAYETVNRLRSLDFPKRFIILRKFDGSQVPYMQDTSIVSKPGK